MNQKKNYVENIPRRIYWTNGLLLQLEPESFAYSCFSDQPQQEPALEPPPPAEPTEQPEPELDPEGEESGKTGEEGEIEKQNGDGSDKDDSEEDSDDDVNVVIGDIKTSPAYSSLNMKRGGLLTATVGDKAKQPQQQAGKFTVEEFDHTGMINGVPAVEFNLDSLEDKPWRKPGADITDYFNYGFNEDTWRAYCERQKRCLFIIFYQY